MRPLGSRSPNERAYRECGAIHCVFPAGCAVVTEICRHVSFIK